MPTQLKSKKNQEKKCDLCYERFINRFGREMLAEVTQVSRE